MDRWSKATCLFKLAVLIGLAVSGAAQANAPGYQYVLLWTSQDAPLEELDFRHSAINSVGEVVYVTRESQGFSNRIYRIYSVFPGLSSILVAEFSAIDTTRTLTLFGESGGNVGINDAGIVSVPVRYPQVDANGDFIGYEPGFELFDPGFGKIGELRDIGFSSSGRLNLQRQMGGRELVNTIPVTNTVFVTDGVVKESTNTGNANNGFAPSGPVQVNEFGTVGSTAASRDTVNNVNLLGIGWATPPGAPQSVLLGDRNTDAFTVSKTPGLNNLGWLSFATNGGTGDPNPNPRVIQIRPDGTIFTIADTTDGQFVDFWQARGHGNAGVSLNSFNRTSFIADLADGSESIWVGDASGDPPRLAVDQDIAFTNGWRFEVLAYSTDVTSHGANSMSRFGDIAVGVFGLLFDQNGTLIETSARAMFVAVPLPGLEPGRPILPDTSNPPPRGFRLRRGACSLWLRCWFDPPVATGYEYEIEEISAGSFTSVLIPVPLPNGDAEFAVTANGVSAPLEAGFVFEFDSITSNPVRYFTITDIDESEALDPADPEAFVTGLTFSEEADDDLSLMMIPITNDPDDSDGDGVGDATDNCPNTPNADQVDSDEDGTGDACDDDLDGDGIGNAEDNCPGTANQDQADLDGDGVGNACDDDIDGDDVDNGDDNCPQDANPDQANTDGDGLGDACDPDLDGDGVDNDSDNCLAIPNPDQSDIDGNGVGDACENDEDLDGVPDDRDMCPNTADMPVDPDSGCSVEQTCPCEGPRGSEADSWKNHGQYVRCVARTADAFLEAGLIDQAEKDAISSLAGQSSCGS